MPRKNPLKHAKEAWGQEGNPFPATAMAGEDSTDAPYDRQVLANEHEQFIEKLMVKAALPPGREFGYLWSLGRRDDTGFGKTCLMLRMKSELKADFGAQIAESMAFPQG